MIVVETVGVTAAHIGNQHGSSGIFDLVDIFKLFQKTVNIVAIVIPGRLCRRTTEKVDTGSFAAFVKRQGTIHPEKVPAEMIEKRQHPVAP